MSDGNGRFTILSHTSQMGLQTFAFVSNARSSFLPRLSTHIRYQIIIILYEPFVPLFMLFNPITDLFSNFSMLVGGTMNLI